jgi:hypothetical protein
MEQCGLKIPSTTRGQKFATIKEKSAKLGKLRESQTRQWQLERKSPTHNEESTFVEKACWRGPQRSWIMIPLPAL